MNRLLHLFTLLFLFLSVQSQDFSNKGKDFWLVFPPLQLSVEGNLANLSVYISSDKASSGNIFVNGIKIDEFKVEPNVTKEYILNRDVTYITPAERASSGNILNIATGKGINVVVDDGKPPVVVYAHMYSSRRSGASIVLPTIVLQRKYVIMSFTQVVPVNQDDVNNERSRSQFSVVAVKDNTKLKIKLRRNGVADPIPLDVDLPKKGDVYQFQDIEDLTGTEIESVPNVNTGTCNEIAVFSGSSANIIRWPGINPNSVLSSKDPLFQQCYPENTWGRNYIITDFQGKQNMFFRILAKEDGTEVFLPNKPPILLNRGQFYDGNSSLIRPPFQLNSNKPISVAQFTVSQNFDGSRYGDPEMLILNTLEQSVDNVTVFLSSKSAITEQYVNVVIKDEGINDFQINNIRYASEFIKIPNTDYSYLKKSFPVSFNSFYSLNMKAKIGFNAFCYGFGEYESYSYSAGTNVRDLYQSVNIANKEAVIPFTRTCVNTPFRVSVTLPYEPVSLKWDFTNSGQLVDDSGNPFASFAKSLGGAKLPADSSYQSENDPNVTLFVYKLDKLLLVKQKSNVPYKVTTISSSVDGCTGEQIIENVIEVKDPPKSILAVESSGCVGSSIKFKATDILDEGVDVNFYRWYLDNQLINNETQFELNRIFSSEGTHNISVEMISKIGCISDKVSKSVNLSFKPTLRFNEDDIRCIGKSFNVKNLSTKNGNSSIVEGVWKINNFYEAPQSSVKDFTYTTNMSSILLKYIAKTNTGCTDSTAEKTIVINPNPLLSVVLPEICLTDGIAQFKANTSISSPDKVSVVNWDFGDALINPANNLADGEIVSHLYSATGPYQMKIKSVSNNNCITTIDTVFFVNGSNPNADFSFLNSTFCSNKEIVLKNKSNVFPGKITKVELVWKLQDGLITNQLDNEPDTNLIYKKLFEDFIDESKILDVKLIAYSGESCKSEYNAPPTLIYGSAKVDIGILGEICTGYPAIFLPMPKVTTVSNTSGIGRYFGPFVNEANIPNQFKFTPPKSGLNSAIYYSYITSKGCETLDTAIIKLNPTPIVNAGPDLQILQDSSIKINASVTNGVDLNYRWDPATDLDNSTILQPTILNAQNDLKYILTVSSKKNCISRDTLNLTVLNILNPPNTLLPGRPPYDKWVIDNIQKYIGCKLKIFDINGRLIKSYENGYDNNQPWNGTRDKTGEYLPAGTYYYILDPKNGRKIQTGYVTILR